MAVIARECIDCGEVFEDLFASDTCPFCQGKIAKVIEFTCKVCGQIFETHQDEDSCPYCGTSEIEELD
ncbi:MAG: hypothetical protein K9L57_06015 [Spirochaetaceae bacterium]|nr:hypothetical protein [Spirochaetaceae bacterium]